MKIKYALLLAMLAAPAAAQTTVTVTETFQIDSAEEDGPSMQTSYGERLSIAGMPELPEGAVFVSGTFDGQLRWTQHGDFDPYVMGGQAGCRVPNPNLCGTSYDYLDNAAFAPTMYVSILGSGCGFADGPQFGDPGVVKNPCYDPAPFTWDPVDLTAPLQNVALYEPLDLAPFDVGHEEYQTDAPQTYFWNSYYDSGCGWTNLYYREYRLTGVYMVTYELDKPAQTLVCGGNFPLQRQETVEAFMDGDDLLLVSEGENPNAFGFLFFNQGLGVFPGGGFVCVRGPALRSVPYQGDSAGRAVGRLEGLPLGTWYLQRVHRESAPGWGSASSGPAIEVLVQ